MWRISSNIPNELIGVPTISTGARFPQSAPFVGANSEKLSLGTLHFQHEKTYKELDVFNIGMPVGDGNSKCSLKPRTR